jgi:hypothetical protein
MHLTWALCFQSGKERGWLWDRQNGQVSVGLNDQRTASVETSLEENVIRILRGGESLSPGRGRVKVWAHIEDEDPLRYLLFNGRIEAPKTTGTRIELPAVCPSGRLLKSSPAVYPSDPDETPAEWDVEELEQSEAMWQLIHRSDRRARELDHVETTGIIKGDLDNSRKVKNWKFSDGSTTWDLELDLSKGDRSPDFELEPLDRDDYIHAQLNTFWPKQGSNKTDSVILEYGRNIAPNDFSYEPTTNDLCNRYALVGSSDGLYAPVYVAENKPSMKTYGVHHEDGTADTSDMDKLKDKAKAHVAKLCRPVKFVDVTTSVEMGGTAVGFSRSPEGEFIPLEGDRWAVPPKFGPGSDFDYWIGDTVTIRAVEQFNFDVGGGARFVPGDLHARVIDAVFNEIDKDGNVAIDLTLAPIHDLAHTTGYESRARTKGF